MDGQTDSSDRLGVSVRMVSAIGRSVSTLIAEMEHELRLMAGDLMQPSRVWDDHRPSLRRLRAPGFRPE